jgi:hypothetical protein
MICTRERHAQKPHDVYEDPDGHKRPYGYIPAVPKLELFLCCVAGVAQVV